MATQASIHMILVPKWSWEWLESLNIILFGGNNNIDNILNIPPNLKSSFISGFDVMSMVEGRSPSRAAPRKRRLTREIHRMSMSMDILNHAKTEFSELINFIHSWCSAATISIFNILPRESLNRNTAINASNSSIKHLSMINNHITMISTEYHRRLFSTSHGSKKNQYFA